MDLKTIQRIGGLYSAVREIADATSHDLTLRQALVLLHVGSMTSPITQQQLAEEHGLGKSTVSKIVGNLAGTHGDVKRAGGLGMLTVRLDPDDLRNRLIELSRQGERVLTRAAEAA